MSSNKIRVEVVEGVEGPSLYVDDNRVAGNKPWGGGRMVYQFHVNTDRIKEALLIFEAAVRAEGEGK